MVSTISLVATENCNGLPPEVLLHILSYVNVPALGRLACVSKALLSASEDNKLWKSLYERQWSLPVEWIDAAPSKWKEYYLTVVKVRRIAPENFDDEKGTSAFWSYGLPEESANYKAHQKTLDLQQACIMVAKGANLIVFENSEQFIDEFEEEIESSVSCSLELIHRLPNSKNPSLLPVQNTGSTSAKNTLTITDKSKDYKIFIKVFNILHLLRTKGRIQAQAKFLEHRKEFESYSRLLGWWLSEIVHKDLQSKNASDKINFPSRNKPDKQGTRDFLQGFFLTWLKYGEAETHFNTLRALRKLAQETKESGVEKSPKGIFLEELIIWTLCRNKSSFDLESLANLYLHFPQQYSVMYLVNNPSQEKLPDSHLLNADELEKAVQLYLRVIRLYPPQQVPLRLATNLSLALIQLKQVSPTTPPQDRVLLLPLSIFQTVVNHRERIRIKDLDIVTHFIALFQIKQGYPFIEACLKWIHPPYDEKTLQQMTCFLCTKISFYQQTANFIEALYAWIDLCNFLAQEKQAKLPGDFDLFETLYSLLNTSKQVCEEMLSIPSKLPPIQLAVAYAFYRLNKIEESLRIAMRVVQYFNKSDLQWLSTLSQVDFRAVVIYSLCLGTVDELENYYLEEILDYHSTKRFYIYHNLATRIYFLERSDEELDQEEMEKAIEHAEEAVRIDPDEPEPHILIGLCHSFNGDHEEARYEIKAGVNLCPERFSLEQEFKEEQLLIFPVE